MFFNNKIKFIKKRGPSPPPSSPPRSQDYWYINTLRPLNKFLKESLSYLLTHSTTHSLTGHSALHNARYSLNRSSLGTDWSIVMTRGSNCHGRIVLCDELWQVGWKGVRERYSLLYNL